MTDYYLDPEITNFLKDSESFYPSNAVELSIEQNRRCYKLLCDAYQADISTSVTKSDSEILGRNGSIPIRTYSNLSNSTENTNETTLLYFHGGGFILGNLESHDSICADICDRTGLTLIAVDYHLAPEYQFPIQVEDAVDVFVSIDQGKTIVLGDSAGGHLAASVSVHQRHSSKKPQGQLLIYPSLGGKYLDLDSYSEKHDAPGLSRDDVDKYTRHWGGDKPDINDPTFAPLMLEDFSALPPCIAIAAEHDPLRDDAVVYSNKLNQAGVKSKSHIEPGLIHGYLRARNCSEKARSSFSNICNSIQELNSVIE